MSWHHGATLCQTVYTSLHFLNIEHIPQAELHLILRSYVLAVAKSIDLAYSEMNRGRILDGEDCFLDHFGLSVHLEDPTADILTLLSEAMSWSYDRPQILYRLQSRDVSLVSDRHRPLQVILKALASVPLNQPRLPKVTLIERPSTSATRDFDDVSGYLRQCMPLPTDFRFGQTDAWLQAEQLLKCLLSHDTLQASSEIDRKVR